MTRDPNREPQGRLVRWFSQWKIFVLDSAEYWGPVFGLVGIIWYFNR